MSIFTFLFLAILVGGCVHLIDSWIKHRNSRNESADEELLEALQRIDQLEERIRVLERIVTEQPTDLKGRIEAL